MFYHYSQLMNHVSFTACISFAVAFVILKTIDKSSTKFFSLLFVESPKSPTGAKLLGGLALALGVVASLVPLLVSAEQMSTAETSLILSFMISAMFISAAGYIDDRFEIRARHKLLLQFVSISIFSFQAALYLESKNVLSVYAIVTGTGFLLVNGTNLLDGLDTLSIKLSTVTASAFIFLGIYSQSPTTILLSAATLASLGAFYFFNRAPARIYLGEIGGSLLGLIFTAQAILCFQGLRSSTSTISGIAMVMIAVSLPICELGISFLRRVYFKKSPFKGDKLHLHYILKTKGHFSTNAATNVMALGNLTVLIATFALAMTTSKLLSAIFLIACYSAIYIGYCKSEWLRVQQESEVNNLFENLKNKQIYLVSSSELDHVNVPPPAKEVSREKKVA